MRRGSIGQVAYECAAASHIVLLDVINYNKILRASAFHAWLCSPESPWLRDHALILSFTSAFVFSSFSEHVGLVDFCDVQM